MLYVNTGNKSIYNTSVVGALPSPQGSAAGAETVDLTALPPVKRSALSLITAPAQTVYYPINLFRWNDAASVSAARTMTEEDQNVVLTTRGANYAVFAPPETRTDSEIIVSMFEKVGVQAVVRGGGAITGDNARNVFEATSFPTGDLIVVSDFSSGLEVVKQVVQLTSFNVFVVDMELNGGGRKPASELTAIKVDDPQAAGYPVVEGVTVYELTPTALLASQSSRPSRAYRANGSPKQGDDQLHDTTQAYNQVTPERYQQLMTGPRERVVRHGTVSSLLATLNGAQYLALHDTAAVRAGLIERAIADADVIGTDIISVAITYPIKEDTYVDEELGQRYDRSIIINDNLVTISVVKRMSRARRFMSWFLIPTAITAGVVAIVKDSISIGRGRA